MYSLHFGNNYTGQDAALAQCQADAYKMQEYVRYKYKRPRSKVCKDYGRKQMLYEIRKAIWLANKGARRSGRFSLWITYSGHGSWIRDSSGDESDGLDEVLVPTDYQTAGYITDDLLRTYLTKLDRRVRCYLVIDCCHSGTSLDLPYKFSGRTKDKLGRRIRARVVCISACQDREVAYENASGGFLTAKFLEVLAGRKNLTLQALLKGLTSLEGQTPLLTFSRALPKHQNLFI